MSVENNAWKLAARPNGDIQQGDLEWVSETLPDPEEGEICVRHVYLSLDPTNRIWMSDIDQYMPPVAIGEVMRGGTLGVVEASNANGYAVGDIVNGMGGWQKYTVGPANEWQVLPKDTGLPMTAFLGCLSFIGMTAYFGLLDICDPKPGETVVVNAAAGAVGSLVGQIAKIKDTRVVGIAGTDNKCKWIKDDLGFDEAINYKTENVLEMLKKHCPDGIDCVFENVGGQILDDELTLMNNFSRIALCGLISTYNDLDAPGPKMFRNILMKRIMIKGFIVSDYMARAQEAMADLSKWVMEGKLQYRVDVRPGLENAPQVVKDLFVGANTGKLMIQISDE